VDNDDDVARASATLGRDVGNEVIAAPLEVQVGPVTPNVLPFREPLAGIRVGEDNAQLKVGNRGVILATP
jgi:hypothetical protein